MGGYKHKSQEELRFEDLFTTNAEYKKVKEYLDDELADRGKELECR